MPNFFDLTREQTLDRLSFQMLKTACSRESLAALSTQSFNFTSAIPRDLKDAATTWLDDTVFGKHRVRFYSANLQLAYEQFCVEAERLWVEIGKSYSTDGKGELVVNYTDLNGGQKTDLAEKLKGLAKQTYTSYENLERVARDL